MDQLATIERALRAVERWEEGFGPFDPHPSLQVDGERLQQALDAYTDRLRGNYPFFHPRYAGQMLKPPHPAAVAAYVAAMHINPNNHALDGGPPTSAMEVEVVRKLAAMFHLPEEALGHLTSSGTIANLESLYVARELHPGKAVAFSTEAHYTHGRMCRVLGIPTVVVGVDEAGRMDVDRLEVALDAHDVGTVVATAGTTGLGVVDPIEAVRARCHARGVRVHVDAAYGGFFSILAWGDAPSLAPPTRRRLRAIATCDSVVVDPHKHGLQPYGCGCVLFRDPTVGRFYKHDSPYTYFTSDALHLGEISLECSRAGAAAGALWLTLELLPLTAEGLGQGLAAGLRAAHAWHERLAASSDLHPFTPPELDIVTFFPEPDTETVSAIDDATSALFDAAMHDPDDPIFLSMFRVDGHALQQRRITLQLDVAQARILRSVLMKPEHETYVPHLHQRLEALAAGGGITNGTPER